MKNLVSIIIPVYNSEKYIRETLDSVLAQTFENWELEITDDCSTDRTAEIIKEYTHKDPRIHYWRLNNNSGAGAARNNSIQRAQGEFLAFIDGDDWWYPTKLEEQLKFMKENKYEFTCTYYEDADENLNVYYTMKQPAKISYKKMLLGCSVGTPGVIINTTRIGKKYMPNTRRAEDWKLWLDILKDVDYLYTYPKALWKYRHLNYSQTSNKGKMFISVVQMYRDIFGGSIVKSLLYSFFIFLPNNIVKKIRKYTK